MRSSAKDGRENRLCTGMGVFAFLKAFKKIALYDSQDLGPEATTVLVEDDHKTLRKWRKNEVSTQ